MAENDPHNEPDSMDELLEDLSEVDSSNGKVSLKEALYAVGRSSFGPLLAVAGIITLFPLVGDIPGVPTAMGILVMLTCGQLLFGRDHIWLPSWLLKRSVQKEKLQKAIDDSRKPARWMDHFIGSRLLLLTSPVGAYALGAGGMVVAVAMPFMEFIPLSANVAGGALLAIGLALTVRDGILALAAHILVIACVAIVLSAFLWGGDDAEQQQKGQQGETHGPSQTSISHKTNERKPKAMNHEMA